MDRFLIESHHSVEDCKRIVKMIYALGYLNNFDWGCKSGVHTGWAVIEAENEAQALWTVPILVRNKARAVKLEKFDSKIVDEWSKEKG